MHWIGWTFLAFLISIPLWVTDQYFIHILITTGIFVIAAMSLNLLLGYTGQLSLGHVAFFGIGAYTSAAIAAIADDERIAVLDGKLLCVQLTPYNNLTAEGDPFWCLPGGGLDGQEGLQDAMHRYVDQGAPLPLDGARRLHQGTDREPGIFHNPSQPDA